MPETARANISGKHGPLSAAISPIRCRAPLRHFDVPLPTLTPMSTTGYQDAKTAEAALTAAKHTQGFDLKPFRLLRIRCDHNRALIEVYQVNDQRVMWAHFTGRVIGPESPYYNPDNDPDHYVRFPADEPPPKGRITRQRWAAALPESTLFDSITTHDVATESGCCVASITPRELRRALDDTRTAARTRVMRFSALHSQT